MWFRAILSFTFLPPCFDSKKENRWWASIPYPSILSQLLGVDAPDILVFSSNEENSRMLCSNFCPVFKTPNPSKLIHGYVIKGVHLNGAFAEIDSNCSESLKNALSAVFFCKQYFLCIQTDVFAQTPSFSSFLPLFYPSQRAFLCHLRLVTPFAYLKFSVCFAYLN